MLKYLVNKYVEIGLSHTVVIGSNPAQGLSLFKNDYVHVDETMSIADIERTIMRALADETTLRHHADVMAGRMKVFASRYRDSYILKSIQVAGL